MGVYRVRGWQGNSVVVYRWHPDEDRWPSAAIDENDEVPATQGRDAFLAAHALLGSIGLRVPVLHDDEVTDAQLGGHLVVIEDLGDRTLADVLDAPSPAREEDVDDFAAMVRRLHDQQGSRPGPLTAPDRTARTTAFQDRIVRRAQRDVIAAGEHPALRALGPRLEVLLADLARQVLPRGRWTLLHGELGPDHVLVPQDGRPCMIDIEGLRYGDVEWERAYLALRLGPWYERLAAAELDSARLELYTLTHHLSLVAGPMLLLSAIGPDERFEAIIAHNAAKLVDLVTAEAPTRSGPRR